MKDSEKVQLMRDCNWKPASTYWYELYQKEKALKEVLLKQLCENKEAHSFYLRE